jgi:hypothetical protein
MQKITQKNLNNNHALLSSCLLAFFISVEVTKETAWRTPIKVTLDEQKTITLVRTVENESQQTITVINHAGYKCYQQDVGFRKLIFFFLPL